jgi:hypothetical protein
MKIQENEYEITIADGLTNPSGHGCYVTAPEGSTFAYGHGADHAEFKPYTSIYELIQDQKTWFDGTHRTANEGLYLLLQRCYALYKRMCSDQTMNEQIDNALDMHLQSQGQTKRTFSSGISKIVTCVFGADRRRVSSYCIALRIADDEKISVELLPDFLRNAGGVEEVRRKKKADTDTPLSKPDKARKHLTAALCVIQADTVTSRIVDKTAIGKATVLIATQGASGSLTVNEIDQSDGVVNAALTALYNKHKKAWAEA